MATIALLAFLWKIVATAVTLETRGSGGIVTAISFFLVGHRSVYASQRIGLFKSAGLDTRMDAPIGELTRSVSSAV